MRKIIYFFIRKFYKKSIKIKNSFATLYFIASTGAQNVRSIKYPCQVVGGNMIKIKDGVQIGPWLRLEAITRYGGQHYKPQVLIGQNVCFGSCCHIGAINRIEIHDDVLISSNVLITDHQHGNLSKSQLDMRANDRPLHSKGPVIIGSNAWIGENVSIMPNVKIGRNAIVGAGSVVTSDVPDNSICAGVPAKVIKQL